MAFLDNSGDIILDAVLTDAGRQRLAKGNFKIVKFAFGDEEINYSIYNSSHPSGSAFYDLEVMQTPILEAFTNNTSLMKSKLVTINRNNILYMPTFKLSDGGSGNKITANKSAKGSLGLEGYVLTADLNTTSNGNTTTNLGASKEGVLLGDNSPYDKCVGISIDTGIESDSQSTGLRIVDEMPADLLETAFLVRVDHRLIRLHEYRSREDTPALAAQFVDDDSMATYYFALGDNTAGTVYAPRGNFRKRKTLSRTMDNDALNLAKDFEVFDGPLGTVLVVRPKAAPNIRNSMSLFNKFGNDSSAAISLFDGSAASISSYKYIDTTINVVGVTTGQSIDIPIRIIKKV
ncbi:MAG TPA: hypothetical protein DCM40_08055 [Maribacter sp.]|nr:hypothetical protein [Maribacter sp.]